MFYRRISQHVISASVFDISFALACSHDICTLSELSRYLSVHHCMLSVEDSFPRSRHEDVVDMHFRGSSRSNKLCPGLGSSTAVLAQLVRDGIIIS